MRYETVTVRHGEDVGPVDWSHEYARDKPDHWKDAEQNPEAYQFIGHGRDRNVYCICMYDGWPYWKPTPAMLVDSPIGGLEWVYFNSYGVNDWSLALKGGA